MVHLTFTLLLPLWQANEKKRIKVKLGAYALMQVFNLHKCVAAAQCNILLQIWCIWGNFLFQKAIETEPHESVWWNSQDTRWVPISTYEYYFFIFCSFVRSLCYHSFGINYQLPKMMFMNWILFRQFGPALLDGIPIWCCEIFSTFIGWFGGQSIFFG